MEENERVKEENQGVKEENEQVKEENEQVKEENQRVKEVIELVRKENEQVKEEIERVREEHDQVEEEQEKLKEQLEKLKKEHDAFLLETVAGDVLSRKVQMTSIESDFQDNNDKVRYFTGLTNWNLLSKLYQFVAPRLFAHHSLTQFQQLMITLMRLRLGKSGIELGYQFGIHPSTVSRVFSDVICLPEVFNCVA